MKLFYEYILWLLIFFVPRHKNLWVFGSMRGKSYLDNARYLFEYVNAENQVRAIWISKNKFLVRRLQQEGFEAYYEYSLKAVWYCARAKVAVVTHRGNRRLSDLPFYLLSKKTAIIQLWHGVGLKKTAFDDKTFSFQHDESSLMWVIKAYVKKILFPYLDYVNHPKLVLALAENTQKIFSNAFRVPLDSVVITGYPRNDVLLRNECVSREGSNNERIQKIIYMPTFRGGESSEFDLFERYGFDVQVMEAYLYKENFRLDIKLHPFNFPSKKVLNQLVASELINIIECDHVYDVLHEYAMLITDYSSVYFDYLLLDRPIIYSPFDKEHYLEEERQFYFDYDRVTPGPKARDWVGVMDCIQMYKEDSSLYSAERKSLRNDFHLYQDDGSSARVFSCIESVLIKKN